MQLIVQPYRKQLDSDMSEIDELLIWACVNQAVDLNEVCNAGYQCFPYHYLRGAARPPNAPAPPPAPLEGQVNFL